MNNAMELSPTVCIVDDDPGVREALDGLLRSSGLATSMHGSLDDFRATAPPGKASCLLLDVHMPGQTGLDFLIAMSDEQFDIPVVLITGFGDIPLAVRAMKAGAIDVLPKPFTDTELLKAVAAGIEAGRVRRHRRDRTKEVMARFKTLSRREREVMTLVTAGLMNKQVAWRLGLSEVTVKIHRGKVMRKMGVRSLPDLVRMAEIAGTLDGSPEPSPRADRLN